MTPNNHTSTILRLPPYRNIMFLLLSIFNFPQNSENCSAVTHHTYAMCSVCLTCLFLWNPLMYLCGDFLFLYLLSAVSRKPRDDFFLKLAKGSLGGWEVQCKLKPQGVTPIPHLVSLPRYTISPLHPCLHHQSHHCHHHHQL